MLPQTMIHHLLFLLMVFTGFGCSRALLEEELAKITAGKEATSLPAAKRTLKSLKISPELSTVEVGDLTQLHLVATYSDGSTEIVDSETAWSSLSPSLSQPQSGETVGLTRGVGIITAIYEGIEVTALMNVVSSQLLSIEVTPLNQEIMAGVTQNFIATGIYGDNTKADITKQVIWSVGNPSVASISNDPLLNGHATGLAAGFTTVTASLAGLAGSTGLVVKSVTLTNLQISPQAATIPESSTISYQATATYSDGKVADVTENCLWTSSDATVATVSMSAGSMGKGSSLKAGQTIITARLNGMAAQANLTVSAAALESLAITPGNSTGALGIQQQFRLIGTFSDGSTQDVTSLALWTSSDILKLLVSTIPGLKGQALALLPGTVVVSASYKGMVATTPFTVTSAVLISLDVTPSSLTLAAGAEKVLKAVGTFSDGTTKDLTNAVVWTVTDPSAATISNDVATAGKIVAETLGVTRAIATSGLISGETLVTTTNAVLSSISLNTSGITTPLGAVANLVATGNYSDGSTADVTNLVTWTSSNPLVLSPSNATGLKGAIYSLAVGSGLVTATLGNISQTSSVTVKPKELVSISVTPGANTVLLLGLTRFKATGLYSDGTSADLTTSVTWSLSDTTLATISTNGNFFGLRGGQISVIATLGSVSKSTPIIIIL